MDKGISNIIAAVIGAAATIIVGLNFGPYGPLQQENATMKQELSDLQQAYSALQQENSELREQLSKQDENSDLLAQISTLKSEKSDLESRISAQTGENARLSAQINTQQETISQLKAQIDAQKEEISRLNTQIFGSSTGNISMHYFQHNGSYIGALSNAYASQIISFVPGNPWTNVVENQKEANVLGFPSDKDLCLGILGTIVLSFDVEMYDGDGPDIYLYEAGGGGESVKLEISSDCETWYNVGIVKSDGFADFSKANIPENSAFRYVRISDLGNGGGDWPGFDLGAVCGLNVKIPVLN